MVRLFTKGITISTKKTINLCLEIICFGMSYTLLLFGGKCFKNTAARKIPSISNDWIRISVTFRLGWFLRVQKIQRPPQPKNLPQHLYQWWSDGVQSQEKRPIDKILVIRVSKDSGQGGGQPTPTVHSRNMDKRYNPPPPLLRRRTKFKS